jgi:hypothetical protein
MAEELFAIGYEAPASVEFVGFESTPEASGFPENRQTEAPATAKPRRRGGAKPRKKTHPVRVWFDDRELSKLNSRADVEGVTLPEYVRVRALRDPRGRGPQTAPGEDLFARADPARAKLRSGRLPPPLERRISAYYSAASGTGAEPARPRPKIDDPLARSTMFTRLGHFFTELVSSRISGHGAAPGTGA